MTRITLLAIGIALSPIGAPPLDAETNSPPVRLKVAEAIDVGPVWSGHPVGFALLTCGQRQYVAFYDADRRMTVGARSLDSREWDLVRLPSNLKWDSHNYITMALDDDGLLHLSGNMHCVPLIYFRTEKPHDIHSFQQVAAMVARNERRCTYPRFLRGAAGELIFTYRDGSSGNGDQIFNVYDLKSRTWRRLLDEPLFAGQGKMNAYFQGPVRDEQGVFHVCWVWRDTPDCATNHDLCYARSRDLVHWETSAGKPLAVPISLRTAEIVDPVPPGGGIINGNTKIGFDAAGRVILSYHKYDAQGKTQIYNARREADGWKLYQASQWKFRWEFQGGGSIGFGVHVGSVVAAPDGTLSQGFGNKADGSGNWRLDPDTLRAAGRAPATRQLPSELGRVESKYPEMQVRRAADLGSADEPGVEYLLRWETLPPNRDRPRPGDPPPPSMLRLYKLTM